MKNNENEEEWIEMTVVCPDCIQGRVAYWKDSRTGKHPWRYHLPCETCKGNYSTTRWQPTFCQIEGCEEPAKEKCTGVFCSANGWVCEEHWKEENIGYSERGYVCINCWHEVGSGGH